MPSARTRQIFVPRWIGAAVDDPVAGPAEARLAPGPEPARLRVPAQIARHHPLDAAAAGPSRRRRRCRPPRRWAQWSRGPGVSGRGLVLPGSRSSICDCASSFTIARGHQHVAAVRPVAAGRVRLGAMRDRAHLARCHVELEDLRELVDQRGEEQPRAIRGPGVRHGVSPGARDAFDLRGSAARSSASRPGKRRGRRLARLAASSPTSGSSLDVLDPRDRPPPPTARRRGGSRLLRGCSVLLRQHLGVPPRILGRPVDDRDRRLRELRVGNARQCCRPRRASAATPAGERAASRAPPTRCCVPRTACRAASRWKRPRPTTRRSWTAITIWSAVGNGKSACSAYSRSSSER